MPLAIKPTSLSIVINNAPSTPFGQDDKGSASAAGSAGRWPMGLVSAAQW
tara:strand:+ start:281 stop:430 length:150 start_codon:yes stop_codon:yes gene_type:complete